MADDNFRSYRSRDRRLRRRAPWQPDDPLAELARLIGQSEPATAYGRDARGGPAFDQPAGGLDWAAEDRYAAPATNRPKPITMRPDERYAPAQHADLLPTFRPGAPSHDDAHEPPASRPFSPPAPQFQWCPRLRADTRSGSRVFATSQSRRESVGRQPPAFCRSRPTSVTSTTIRRSRCGRSSLCSGRLRGGSPRRPPAQRLRCRRRRFGSSGARNCRRVRLSRHVRQFDAAVAAADHQGG